MKDNISKGNELISVVIPTYNRADIISKSIESVLNQTYRNIELIIVDDGSTDDTVKNLREIKDKRLRIVQLEKNSGMCAARNAGAKVANGVYIAVQDSDVIWDEKKIERQYEHIKNTNFDITFCRVSRGIENGIMTTIPRDNFTLNDDIYKMLLTGNFIDSPTILMKKKVTDLVEFDPIVRRFTDWDFSLRALKSGFSIGYLPELLVTSYIQNDSTSNTENEYESLKFIYNRFKEDIDLYPEVKAICLYNFGAICSSSNRKSAIMYFRESLKLKFFWKTVIRLILLKIGLMEFVAIIRKKLNY
ncbi:glycosyltransferase family 2 protein [Tenacibaculum aiptasiae]|uniref:glycosyltransferase family 2 protein n=1 Tax=Tenacibaculum aiptasiae TaxID=426481 RepID=UPI002331316B|nr:glycosyltransferase family 2 protein [Tenacibaculum aiptasiae]